MIDKKDVSFSKSQETPSSSEERPQFLADELGPKNKYDVLAGESLVLGRQMKDNALEKLSAELAELIMKIPYNSDQFYKVIAKAREIEERRDKLLEAGFVLLDQSEFPFEMKNENFPWSISLRRLRDGYNIVFDHWRRPPQAANDLLMTYGMNALKKI